jgi:ornithine cyclodeaminase/alanine dehydrogenase-like protein (mu-crystallin family)
MIIPPIAAALMNPSFETAGSRLTMTGAPVRDPNQPPPELLAVVNSRAVAESISMSEAIDLVTLAMQELSASLVTAPERKSLTVSPEGKMVLMPGTMSHIQRFGVKTLSLLETASEWGLPSHQGLMLLFDSRSGRPLCAIDSHALTAIRTAAATAVATRALARRDARSLALVGSGSLGSLHIEAILKVRPIENIRIWSRTAKRASSLAAETAARFPGTVEAFDSVQQTIEGSDIICTLTASATPVLEGKWLAAGQHLNLVGASTRAYREVDDEAVARGYYIADCTSHALEQAGELRHAVEQGYVTEQHIAGEIGEVLNGTKPGRSDDSMITIYKSLGHVAQDLRVADAVFAQLDRSKEAIWVPWPA